MIGISSLVAGLFGKPPQQQQQPQQQQGGTGLFGKPGTQSMTPGQGSSIFGGNQTQTSIFGGNQPQQTQQQPQSVFGSNPQPSTNSIFGQTAVSQSGTSSAAPTTLFGKPVTQPASDPNANLFKPPQTTNPPNNQPSATQNASTVNVTVTGTIYTQLDKLSGEDREQFEAPKFTLGKIPMCPPPIELI